MEKLKFTNKAIYRLEKEKDVKIGQIAGMADAKEFKLSLVIDLLWAGQLHNNPQLTVDEVLEEFDMQNVQEYVEPLSKALEKAFGDIEPEGNEKKPERATSAG